MPGIDYVRYERRLSLVLANLKALHDPSNKEHLSDIRKYDRAIEHLRKDDSASAHKEISSTSFWASEIAVECGHL